MIKLNNSCRAASNKFVIPKYYEWNERIRKPDSLGKLLKSYEISSMQFKDQLKTEFDNVSHIGIPSSLHDIKEMPLDSFLDKISMTSLRQVKDNESKLNPWGFVIAIIGFGIVFITAVIICCKIGICPCSHRCTQLFHMQGKTRTILVAYRARKDEQPDIEMVMMERNVNDVDDADGRQNPSQSLVIERLLTSGRRE